MKKIAGGKMYVVLMQNLHNT